MAVLECNRTVQTTMVWFAYEVIHINVPTVTTVLMWCIGWADEKWQWNGGEVVWNSGLFLQSLIKCDWFLQSLIKCYLSFAILDQVWLSRSQINETVPSYQSSLISIPGLTLNYGLHKLVYKFEVETGETKEVSVFTPQEKKAVCTKTKSLFGTVNEGKFIYIFPVELFLEIFVSDPIECNVNLFVLK